MLNSKRKKIAVILTLSVVGLVALVVLFISPITKYLVERYDVRFTGREIKMNWAYVNPFTGYMHLDGLQIMENERPTPFISMDGLTLNFGMLKMLGGTYEISELKLVNPKVMIEQKGRKLNFSDLLTRFGSDEKKKDTTSGPVRFSLLETTIENGEFHFMEPTIPINYFIKKVNLTSTGFQWDNDTTQSEFSLNNGLGSGTIKGNLKLNIKSLDYEAKINVEKFDLQLIQQYLKQISKYGTIRAILDADLHSTGNFNEEKNVDAEVSAKVSDFHFGKNKDNDFVSFQSLQLHYNRVNPKEGIYDFDTISLVKPYFKFERYDSSDNIHTLFGGKLAKVSSDKEQFNLIIELSRYVQRMRENLLKSNYTLNRLTVRDGHFIYNDYSQINKFSISTDRLFLSAIGIDKAKNKAEFNLETGLKPFGSATVHLSIFPKANKDFDLNFGIKKVPITLFNPFLISVTSFPLERGSLEINGKWKVRNGKIVSQNKLVVLDPKVAKRVKNKETSWLPVPLIMALVRERGNVISYEIPIGGNLDDPKFNIWDPILDAVKNILIKPPTIPYGIHVSHVETKLERLMNLKWETNSKSLRSNSEKFVRQLADFLKENPELKLVIEPELYEDLEKEAIALFEAKRMFYQFKNKTKGSLSEKDSLEIEKITAKDGKFQAFLNARITDSLLFTTQHKSVNVVGEEVVNRQYNRLNQNRKRIFLSYFDESKTGKQVRFKPAVDTHPFNGFSLFKITYEGDKPEKLMDAYSEYDDLNDDFTREQFKKKRPFWRNFF